MSSTPRSRATGGAPEQLADTAGTVTLSMMVGADGKPFEIGVVRSTNRRLEQFGIHVMERADFEPATLGGKPITSVFEIEYRMYSNDDVQPAFRNAVRALRDACAAGDRAAADKALKNLQVTAPPEEAYYGVAQYVYASRWGDATQQEAALWRALSARKYLPPADLKTVLLANFKVQTQKHDYFQTLKMWDELQKAGLEPDLLAKLKPIADQIEQLRAQPAAYDMSGTIPETGDWSVHLFKRGFRAAVSEGHISDVKLKCSRGFVTFKFDPELQYTVEDKYGDCTLDLVGTPGTQLQLTQL
jgi:hypothetical protein